MQRQRGELVPIGDALSGMGGPVQALIPSRSTQHHFTLADQVNQLVEASEVDPDLGFGADDGRRNCASWNNFALRIWLEQQRPAPPSPPS